MFHMEVINLLSSQETWLRQAAGEREAWLMPSWNGRPRIEKPPLCVWINLLAWRGLDPQSATGDQLLYRSRLASLILVAVGLLALAGIGRTLGDWRTAALAPALTGTMLLFIRQSRLASYDTHLVVWVLLALAAGLWAIYAPPCRRIVCGAAWGATGLALAAAVLTKGPLALALTVGTLVVAIVSRREHRREHVRGLMFSLVVMAVLAIPWFVYALCHVAGAAGRLAHEYRAVRGNSQPCYYYLGVIAWVFPWSIWILPAVCSPLWSKEKPWAGRFSPAWIWFVILIGGLSLADAKTQRYAVPALPAAGLLIADYLLRAASSGRWISFGFLLQWVLLAAGAITLPLLILFQDLLIQWGLLKRPELVGLPTPVAILTAVIVLGLVAQGYRLQRRARTFAAVWLGAISMSVLATATLYGYAQSEHGRYADKAVAVDFGLTTRGLPVFCYMPPGGATHIDEPNQRFLFYARRTVPPLCQPELPAVAARDERVLLMARAELDPEVRAAGFKPISEFHDGDYVRKLYENRPARQTAP